MNKDSATKTDALHRHWVVELREDNRESVTLKASGKRAKDGKDFASFLCPVGFSRKQVMKEVKSILRGLEAAKSISVLSKGGDNL